MASNLTDHPHTLGDFICDRLAFVASEPRLSIDTIEVFLRAFTRDMVKITNVDVCNNKHIRIIGDLTEAASFSLSRVKVFRSSNFAQLTRAMMCQLDPEIMPTNDGILGKEWHIKADGPEDSLLIMKVLHWIHHYDRVTVRTLHSRYVELNVTEVGIGTGTRTAECTIQAAKVKADDVLSSLKLIKEIEKQQNLEITITEHGLEINDPSLTELLLGTLKFNKDMRSITVSKCNLPYSVSEHIKRQLHTCNKLELIDFRSSPCMIASLGNTMTSLEKLNLEKCVLTPQVSDQLAQTLPHCHNLKSLHLGFSKITGLIEKIFDQHSVLSFHLLQELGLTHAVFE